MITYTFLQNYWWFLIALLGGLLVFLLFVQGANTLIFRLGRDEAERSLIVNSTGRKWEFTFTTLVTFGGAFFAAFPLFYSTSFGGAYWVWMLILATFVLQAVSYEFQSKAGNVVGRNVYRRLLVLNGVLGPFLLGVAVATFFTGSAFVVDKGAMGGGEALAPAISQWANAWHGLDALAEPRNLLLGFSLVFLARVLGALYLIDNIDDEGLRPRLRRQAAVDAICFLLFFLPFAAHPRHGAQRGLARAAVGQGERALRVGVRGVVGRPVVAGQQEEGHDREHRADACGPDAADKGGPQQGAPDAQQDEHHADNEQGERGGHGEQVVPVLEGLGPYRPVLADGIAAAREQEGGEGQEEEQESIAVTPVAGQCARTAAKDYGSSIAGTGRYHQKGTSGTWLGGNIRCCRFRPAQR